MALNESIVEDAALKWFGELGYAVGHGAAFAGLRRAKPPHAPGEYAKGTLIPAFSQGEREKRESTRRLNPAILPLHSVRSRGCGTAKIFEEGLQPRDGKLLK